MRIGVKIMENNSDIFTPKDASETDERVKELMNDTVVKEHCLSLDTQGITYKVIPLRHSIKS